MEEAQKRTWAEISLGNLAYNYRAIREELPAGCRFMGLVKSNAYGHGALPVARKLEELGADYLAVACLDEAVELRQGGITLPILILGYTPAEYGEALFRYDITQTIYDMEAAEAFSALGQRLGRRLKCHIKVDTGMSRLGFLCDEETAEDSAARIVALSGLPGLKLEGIFTHFADADGSLEYSQLQMDRFEEIVSRTEKAGVHFAIRHCAASAAVLNYSCTHFDMVRPGILLYGHHPDPSTVDKLAVKPVMELKSRVASVKRLPKGTCISYGRTHTLERDSLIAAIPVGYGDGLFRLLSNRMEVLLHGKRVRQVGRICMDMCMLDVTDLPEVSVGDVATVFGPRLPLEEKAEAVGTITYEMLCDVSPRVPRIYVD